MKKKTEQTKTEMYSTLMGRLNKRFPDDKSPINEHEIMGRKNLVHGVYSNFLGETGYDVANSADDEFWTVNTTRWHEPSDAITRNRELAKLFQDELGQLVLTIILH